MMKLFQLSELSHDGEYKFYTAENMLLLWIKNIKELIQISLLN